MSENTKIEWADHSWNPWIGCTKVSPGCAHCYAEVQTFTRVQRAQGRELWGKGKARHRTSEAMWRQPLKWNKNAAYECPACGQIHYICRDEVADSAWECYCSSSGTICHEVRPRVFPSMCDWLDDEVPIEWLADFLKLIHDTPHLDWLLLTKRPENWQNRMTLAFEHGSQSPDYAEPRTDEWLGQWIWGAGHRFPQNVWIGTSVEDQKRADERIPALLRIPAAVRFLSVEPLLERVDIIRSWKNAANEARAEQVMSFDHRKQRELTYEEAAECLPAVLHWVIVGGESGPKARLCDTEWVRSVVRQCQTALVPCFVKQLGATSGQTFGVPGPGYGFPFKIKHPKGGDPSEWPDDLRVREFPRAVLAAKGGAR